MNKKEVKKAPTLRFKGFTNDWEQRKLGEIAKVIGGGTPSTKNSDYWNGNINWYSPTEIGKSNYIFTSKKKITKLGLENSSAKILPGTHTILFTSRAGIGNMAIMQTDGCTNQGFQSWVIDNNTNIYFLYSLGSDLKKEAIRKASGSTFLEISNKEVKKIPLSIPSKHEQDKLGKLFLVLDNLLSLHQRKLKLLKEIRKGIVENIRDNNFEYKEQKNDFKDIKIKDMFKITRGKVLPKEKISSNKISPNIYPVFSSQTLNNGLLGFYKDYLFQNAITWTTDGANAGTVNFRNEKFYSTNVNGVLLQKKIKPDLLTADLLNLVAFKYVSKVGNPKLMNNTMANIRIKIPSNTNARIFYSKILNKYDTKIDFINKKIDYLTTFKRFLLQNMFI